LRFEACSAFTHVSACKFVKSPQVTLYTEVFQRIRLLLHRFDYYRLKQQLPGGDSHPAENRCLSAACAKERRNLEQEAAKHGWTVPDLITAIRRERPLAPEAHGRTVKSPADVETGLQQLVSTGVLWVNRCEVVMELVRSSKPTKARQRLLDAAAEFEKLIQRAMKAARKFREVVGR
jgi:hypothetical protein